MSGSQRLARMEMWRMSVALRHGMCAMSASQRRLLVIDLVNDLVNDLVGDLASDLARVDERGS